MMSSVAEALCGPCQSSRRPRQQCRHLGRRRSLACVSSSGGGAGEGAPVLEVRDLRAKVAGSDKQILQGVSLTIRAGEVHAIMGKNGSGKSTLSKVLVGHPDYEVTGGSVTFKGNDLLALSPEERSHQGLFLSFQSPVEIPGVRCALGAHVEAVAGPVALARGVSLSP
jgi:ABC-type multidrug transport system fused ATPase/permease subunit